MESTFVFVHGSLQGSYSWKKVTRLLKKNNRKFVCLDLPSCGYDLDTLGDMNDDIDCIKKALDETQGQKILVAHSYGGMPITQASADREDIDTLVYLCAFMPDVGDSIRHLSEKPPAFFKQVNDGKAVQHADASIHGDKITYQSTKPFTTAIEKCGWHTIPSVYILCTEDHDIPTAKQQKMSGRAGKVIPLKSGHYPFFTHTQDLVDILLDL